MPAIRMIGGEGAAPTTQAPMVRFAFNVAQIRHVLAGIAFFATDLFELGRCSATACRPRPPALERVLKAST
jgi:hypothetical protein